MIRAIIIDDEQNAREFLQKLLFRYFPKKVTVLEICDSVAIGVEAINRLKPSLVFLDIEMPTENGFELFKYFNQISFDVIFTTSHKDFAIDAIKHAAFDYLLKPINYIDLVSTIKRLEENDRIDIQNVRVLEVLEHIGSDNSSFNKIALPTSNGYELFKLNAIIYCQSESNYCKIICVDGRELLIAKTLKFVEQLLNSDLFIRIHKSYLVNLNYVTKYDKADALLVTLVNGIKLPVSVRKKEQFLKAILHKK